MAGGPHASAACVGEPYRRFRQQDWNAALLHRSQMTSPYTGRDSRWSPHARHGPSARSRRRLVEARCRHPFEHHRGIVCCAGSTLTSNVFSHCGHTAVHVTGARGAATDCTWRFRHTVRSHDSQLPFWAHDREQYGGLTARNGTGSVNHARHAGRAHRPDTNTRCTVFTEPEPG